MKKILFCLQTMVRGGVEKELITILKKMDPNRFDVDVLLCYIQDQNIVSEIPSWVQIVNLDIDPGYYCGSSASIVNARLKKGKLVESGILLGKRLLKIGMTHSNQSLKEIPDLQKDYDCAVCYHIHSPLMLKYVATKVQAKRKIGWIHNDFRTTGYPVQRLKEYLRYYDSFVAVSESVKEEFVNLCPEFTERISVIHNVLDEEEIRALAQEVPDSDSYFQDNRIKLLTVGRFSPQKGIDQAIEVCRSLRDNGCIFCWYFIGWGAEEKNYRALIEKYSLQGCAVILGEKKNPYPYIDNCDIYVQPSRHEAYSMAVLEAMLLRKPMVCRDFAGVREQIQDGVTGYIVPLGDLKALEAKLRYLISNSDERNRLSENLKKETSENSLQVILSKFEGNDL